MPEPESSTGSTVSQGSPATNTTSAMNLRPYAVIVANLPDPAANTYVPLGAYIRDYLNVGVEHVVTYRKLDASARHAIIHFGSSAAACKTAVRLHHTFKKAGHGKADWEYATNKGGPYLWLATAADDYWLGSYTKDYELTVIPATWTTEAVQIADEDGRNVYRAISRFTVRFAYATLAQLSR